MISPSMYETTGSAFQKELSLNPINRIRTPGYAPDTEVLCPSQWHHTQQLGLKSKCDVFGGALVFESPNA